MKYCKPLLLAATILLLAIIIKCKCVNSQPLLNHEENFNIWDRCHGRRYCKSNRKRCKKKGFKC